MTVLHLLVVVENRALAIATVFTAMAKYTAEIESIELVNGHQRGASELRIRVQSDKEADLLLTALLQEPAIRQATILKKLRPECPDFCD